MAWTSNRAGPIALALLIGLGQAACNPRTHGSNDAAAAPIDSGVLTPPSQPARDTPPAAAEAGRPADEGAKTGGLKVSAVEYEGWRQYSVNCARCHGQDALPNPVAANLLLSLGPKGPIKSYEAFSEVVTAGRPATGMPAFKGILTPEQTKAIYAYVKGRAEGRIPPGRPDRPEA
jgi:mono/diheme cytochrome c family protein